MYIRLLRLGVSTLMMLGWLSRRPTSFLALGKRAVENYVALELHVGNFYGDSRAVDCVDSFEDRRHSTARDHLNQFVLIEVFTDADPSRMLGAVSGKKRRSAQANIAPTRQAMQARSSLSLRGKARSKISGRIDCAIDRAHPPLDGGCPVAAVHFENRTGQIVLSAALIRRIDQLTAIPSPAIAKSRVSASRSCVFQHVCRVHRCTQDQSIFAFQQRHRDPID